MAVKPDLKRFEWWTEVDSRIVSRLEEFGKKVGWDSRLTLLEIGVYSGAFVDQALSYNTEATVYGVDPYPFAGGAFVKKQMLDEFRSMIGGGRFVFTENLESVPKELRFHLIHVDGEHTEIAATSDLLDASNRLAEGGIIVVDDVRDRWFPGVSAAVFSFVKETEFRILADTGQKFYLVRERDLDHHRSAFVSTFSPFFEIYSGYADWNQEAKMVQAPDVSGCPILMVEAKVREHADERAATGSFSWPIRVLRNLRGRIRRFLR